VRQQIKQISERIKPKVVVLSHDEVIQDIKIEPIGILRFKDFQATTSTQGVKK
jgi:flagellar biosynthesis component FlhA